MSKWKLLLKALASAKALKTVAVCFAAGSVAFFIIDMMGAKANAAVAEERNRYLLELHRQRDEAEERAAAVREDLAERNADLESRIEAIRAGNTSTGPALDGNGNIVYCPVGCVLRHQ